MGVNALADGIGGELQWDCHPLRFGQFPLVVIEGKEAFRPQPQSGGHVEDIKTTMTACQGVRSRQSIGFSDHIGNVADGQDESPGGAIRLELRPPQGGLALCDELAELREA